MRSIVQIVPRKWRKMFHVKYCFSFWKTTTTVWDITGCWEAGNFIFALCVLLVSSNTLWSIEQQHLRKHTFGVCLLVGVLIPCVHSWLGETIYGWWLLYLEVICTSLSCLAECAFFFKCNWCNYGKNTRLSSKCPNYVLGFFLPSLKWGFRAFFHY